MQIYETNRYLKHALLQAYGTLLITEAFQGMYNYLARCFK